MGDEMKALMEALEEMKRRMAEKEEELRAKDAQLHTVTQQLQARQTRRPNATTANDSATLGDANQQSAASADVDGRGSSTETSSAASSSLDSTERHALFEDEDVPLAMIAKRAAQRRREIQQQRKQQQKAAEDANAEDNISPGSLVAAARAARAHHRKVTAVQDAPVTPPRTGEGARTLNDSDVGGSVGSPQASGGTFSDGGGASPDPSAASPKAQGSTAKGSAAKSGSNASNAKLTPAAPVVDLFKFGFTRAAPVAVPGASGGARGPQPLFLPFALNGRTIPDALKFFSSGPDGPSAAAFGKLPPLSAPLHTRQMMSTEGRGCPIGFNGEVVCAAWFNETYDRSEARPAFAGTWQEKPKIDWAVPPPEAPGLFLKSGIDYAADSADDWDSDADSGAESVGSKDDDDDEEGTENDSDLASFIAGDDEDDEDLLEDGAAADDKLENDALRREQEQRKRRFRADLRPTAVGPYIKVPITVHECRSVERIQIHIAGDVQQYLREMIAKEFDPSRSFAATQAKAKPQRPRTLPDYGVTAIHSAVAKMPNGARDIIIRDAIMAIDARNDAIADISMRDEIPKQLVAETFGLLYEKREGRWVARGSTPAPSSSHLSTPPPPSPGQLQIDAIFNAKKLKNSSSPSAVAGNASPNRHGEEEPPRLNGPDATEEDDTQDDVERIPVGELYRRRGGGIVEGHDGGHAAADQHVEIMDDEHQVPVGAEKPVRVHKSVATRAAAKPSAKKIRQLPTSMSAHHPALDETTEDLPLHDFYARRENQAKASNVDGVQHSVDGQLEATDPTRADVATSPLGVRLSQHVAESDVAAADDEDSFDAAAATALLQAVLPVVASSSSILLRQPSPTRTIGKKRSRSPSSSAAAGGDLRADDVEIIAAPPQDVEVIAESITIS